MFLQSISGAFSKLLVGVEAVGRSKRYGVLVLSTLHRVMITWRGPGIPCPVTTSSCLY